MKIVSALQLTLVSAMLCACSGSGGGYSSGYSSSHYDPLYYRGHYYYDGIYVPGYPDHKPGDRPDAGTPRPSHPIARPDRPGASTRPCIPSRARPMAMPMSRGFGGRGRR